MSRVILVPLLLAAFAVSATRLPAQQADSGTRAHPEIRADVIFTQNSASLQVGGGVQIPAGIYARIGVIGAVGTSLGDSENIDARVDVLARFLFDPFRQSRWGVSAGGGVTVGTVRGEAVRPRMLVAIDLEGRRRDGGISPAFQIGLGGGLRVGAALRWGSARVR